MKLERVLLYLLMMSHDDYETGTCVTASSL